MNVKISDHARKRMMERNISEQDVLDLFNGRIVPTFSKQSKNDDSCVVVEGMFSGRRIRVVYSLETNTVVTVYPVG